MSRRKKRSPWTGDHTRAFRIGFNDGLRGLGRPFWGAYGSPQHERWRGWVAGAKDRAGEP